MKQSFFSSILAEASNQGSGELLLKAEGIAMILVALNRLNEWRPNKVFGANTIREMVRILFEGTFSHKKGLSPAITQVCYHPEEITSELMEEAQGYISDYKKIADDVTNKEGASNE